MTYQNHANYERHTKPSNEYIRTARRFDAIVSNVKETEAYERNIGKGIDSGKAFSQAALEIVEKERLKKEEGSSKIETKDIDTLEVLAHLGGFVQAQQEIDALASQENLTGYLNPNDKQRRHQLKNEYLIPFNHSLKKYINSHPNDGLRESTAALATTYSAHFMFDDNLGGTKVIPTPPEAEDIHRYTDAALRGMRSELAAESLLSAAGYHYEYHVSTEEDAHGTDLYVYMNDDWESVDIKSSITATERSRTKAYENGFWSRAVWTGLRDGDFTGISGDRPGALSIPYEIAELKAPQFIQSIYEMAMEQRPASARS